MTTQAVLKALYGNPSKARKPSPEPRRQPALPSVGQIHLTQDGQSLLLSIEQSGETIAFINTALSDAQLVKQERRHSVQHARQSGRMVSKTMLVYQIPANHENTMALIRLGKQIRQSGQQLRATNDRTRSHFQTHREQAANRARAKRDQQETPVLPVAAPVPPTTPNRDTGSTAVLPVNQPKAAATRHGYKANPNDPADIQIITGQTPTTQHQATALRIRAARDPNDQERLINGFPNEGLYEAIMSHPGARYVKGAKKRAGYFRVPISETTGKLLKVLSTRYGLAAETHVPVLNNRPTGEVIRDRLTHLRNSYRLSNTETLADLKGTLGNLPEIPRPDGLNYLPYQEAGIRYALTLGNALIADEPGLGKTIQAVGVSNALPDTRRILVIPPASLKINWKREWEKWCAKGLSVERVKDGKPDSWPTNADVVILNFDLVEQHHERLTEKPWDILIVDEAHALKTADTKRTKLILGHGSGQKHIPGIPANRKLFLTGTPILNRPLELWPLANALDPDFFSSKRNFEVRYCDGHQTRFGWVAKGASNLDELNRQLRARIMVRRRKSQVLKDLPPKTRQLIELDHPALAAHNDAFSKLAEAQKSLRHLFDQREALKDQAKRGDISENHYLDQASKLAGEAKVAFHQMSEVRKETAIAKVPQVMELLKTTLANGKVILFCHHHEVVEAYADALNKHFRKQAGRNGTPNTVAIVTGKTPNDERQAQADRFQEDDNCQVFIGTIGAAGTGLTLTEASTVLFAELDWVPGNMNQAEDRAHRIGQKDHVLVYHTAIESSLESRMVRRLIEKQATIDAALDDGVVPEPITGNEASTTRQSFEDWLLSIAESSNTPSTPIEDHFSGALDRNGHHPINQHAPMTP